MDADEVILSCKTALSKGNLQERIRAIHLLSRVDDRRACPLVLKSLQDDTLQEDAIVALTQLKDSRALFPLICLFAKSIQPVVHQRILQYIGYTRDPRAEQFLEAYFERHNPPFKDIAESALRFCCGNSNFQYRYAGPEGNWQQALTIEGRIRVNCAELTRNIEMLKLNERGFQVDRPQTYVIDLEGTMYVGGILNEHVQVAQGSDVLAAGEIKIENKDDSWRVDYINNRSNSYFPAPSSFVWADRFFKKSNVVFNKTGFDEIFPRDGYFDSDFLSSFALQDYSIVNCDD